MNFICPQKKTSYEQENYELWSLTQYCRNACKRFAILVSKTISLPTMHWKNIHRIRSQHARYGIQSLSEQKYRLV